MRRALVLAGILVLALGLFVIGRPPAHAATTCAKHTHRVVKHVKRHGKRKKVVRVKHYWTCEEVATPTPAPAPSAPTPTPTAVPVEVPPVPTSPIQPPPAETPVVTPPPPEPEANALGVAADDRGGVKSYTLSRLSVRSGSLTVQLQNKGEDPHDLDIQRIGPSGEPLGAIVKVPVTEPGQNTSASVPVEAGRYRMWCDLYNHAKEGMEATVTVE